MNFLMQIQIFCIESVLADPCSVAFFGNGSLQWEGSYPKSECIISMSYLPSGDRVRPIVITVGFFDRGFG